MIDPSPRARQPMVDEELGLTTVYNGALYNYRELKAELEGDGYRFFSASDTEVVGKAFRAWGPRCVERFNGMFAFVIFDHESHELYGARDRFGIKPLYYAEGPRCIRFASSLPALLQGGQVDTEIDPVALCHYLTLHAIVPSPRTLLRGVRKVPAATWFRITENGSRTEECYWSLHFDPEEGPDLEDWAAEVLAALRRAISRRMVADIPVGVLLSGGLDSSLIVALLHEAGRAPATFSIGFESSGEEAGNEFEFSDRIAEQFGTVHHRIAAGTAPTPTRLLECIGAMSEPMVSHDVVAFHLLSEEVKKTVSAVQTGQGADEVFGGYHWYPRLVGGTDPVKDYAGVFFDRPFEEVQSMVGEERAARDYTSEFVAECFDGGPAELVDKALRLDTTVMLVDDPIKRVDNMTMAFGVEARVPFLDHELVELAARIPARFKIADGGKLVLKTAARSVVPSEVIDRPKGYFPVPALSHLEGRTLQLVSDTLTSSAARDRGLVSHDYVDRLLAAPNEHFTPLRGSKVWQLAVLELWLRSVGV